MSEDPIRLLRCPADGGKLRRAGPGLLCEQCGAFYGADGGVLRLLASGVHAETDHERSIRDREAVEGGAPTAHSDSAMAVDATLEALDVAPHHDVLEMGAGTGRFTRLLASCSRRVVAVDISFESLRVAAGTTGLPDNLTLVHGDATKPFVTPRSFDRVLGTLTSNLPDRESRERSYELAAMALRDDGKFVFTTHHYGVRAKLGRHPKEGRYTENGIYRRLLEPREIRDELSPYFGRIEIGGANVIPPFALRLGFTAQSVDDVCRRVRMLRPFADLLLVTAAGPHGRADRDHRPTA